MSDGAQELGRVTFLLQGVSGIRFTENFNILGEQFIGLFRARGGDEIACDANGSASQNLRIKRGTRQSRICHDLKSLQGGAIVQFNEGAGLRVPSRANPTLGDDVRLGRGGSKKAANIRCRHGDMKAQRKPDGNRHSGTENETEMKKHALT
jgi:hypothetical protein